MSHAGWLDSSGKLSCFVGAHTYVLDWAEDKKLSIILDENSESARRWNIRENNQQQFEIQCKKTNQVIDASHGSTDIRVSNASKTKNKKKKDNHNYWGSSFDENWSTCWLLTDGNGSNKKDVETGETSATELNLNKIDINSVDVYKRNALAHAIFAEEHGINSVKY